MKEQIESEHLNALVRVLEQIASGSYTAMTQTDESWGSLEPLARGLNMLGEQIGSRVEEEAQRSRTLKDSLENIKRTSQRLEQSEQKFRAIADTANDAIIMIDEQGSVIYWNPAAERIFGYTREAVRGRNLHDLVVPQEYHEAHHAAFTRFRQTGEGAAIGQTVELKGLHKQGHEFPVELSLSRVQIDGNWQAIGIVRDISERKQAELDIQQKVTESENQRRAILNILQDVEEGKHKLESINQELETEMAERQRTQQALTVSYQSQGVLSRLAHIALVDKPLKEQLEEALQTILSTPWLQVLPKGCIFLSEPETGELVMVAHQGLAAPLLEMCRRVPQGHCLCGRAAKSKEVQFASCLDERHEISYDGIMEHGHYNVPIMSKGQVLGILNVYLVKDHPRNEKEAEFLHLAVNTLASLIEKEEAEEALKSSEERYRELFENASDLIQSITPEGKIRYVNRAWLEALGYTEEQLSRMTIFDIIHPDCQDHCMQVFQSVMQGEPVENVEVTFLSRTGRKIYLEGSASCKFEEGRPVSTRGIFHDITERKEAEQALQAANAELDAFVRTASHDLRSPLVSLSGFLSLLKEMEGEKLSDQGTRFLERIEANAKRMEQLLDDLLQLSRAGREMTPRQVVDLKRMLELLRSDFAPLMERKGATLILPEDLPKVYGEQSALSQIFTNLITNGLKYMGPQAEPKVELAWTAEENLYHFQVKDNGIGIDPAYHERIFESFQTLQDERAGEVESSGVGLNIVKQIVERHGGEVWVESDGRKGSVFHFTLDARLPEPGGVENDRS